MANDTLQENDEQQEQSQKKKKELDFVDFILLLGLAVLIDLMFFWIPVVGGIVIDVCIAGFWLFFYLTGIDVSGGIVTVALIGGMVPLLPACSGFVITVFIRQQIAKRAGKALKALAPVADVVKQIPGEGQLVAAGVSAANKVVNEKQDVKGAVAGEAMEIVGGAKGGAATGAVKGAANVGGGARTATAGGDVGIGRQYAGGASPEERDLTGENRSAVSGSDSEDILDKVKQRADRGEGPAAPGAPLEREGLYPQAPKGQTGQREEGADQSRRSKKDRQKELV